MAEGNQRTTAYLEGSTAELEKKLSSLRHELVKLKVIGEAEEAEREEREIFKEHSDIEEIIEEPSENRHLIQKAFFSNIVQWTLESRSILGGKVLPYLLRSISRCRENFSMVRKFIDLKFPPRQHQEEEGANVRSMILKWTVELSEGMLSEIFLELEYDRVAIEEGPSSSALVAYKKMTIDQFLENSNKSSVTFESVSFARIRITAIGAAGKLSKVLAQYLFLLSKINDEQATMTKVMTKLTTLIENINKKIAQKFIIVMESTTSFISKEEKKENVDSNEDFERIDRVFKHICISICFLSYILSDKVVPEKNPMVNGARVRVEVILGQILFNLEGIKKSVGTNNHTDDESWKQLKKLIATAWDVQQYQLTEVSL